MATTHLDGQINMASSQPQAIPGVVAGAEAPILTKYPSVACTSWGRSLGMLCESMSAKINGVKLSYILFGLLIAPVAALIYFYLKVAGHRYVLTNHRVQKWAALGNRLVSEMRLSDVDEINVDQMAGQEFYEASDLELLNSQGDSVLRLEAVPRAEIFRQNILESRDARAEVEASLATIQGRESA